MPKRSKSKSRRRKLKSNSNFEYGSLEPRQLLAADLAGTSFDAPENLNWGETVQVQATVKNFGNSRAGASFAKIYMSTNSFISTYDQFLGYQYVPAMSSGASESFTKSIPIPSNLPSGFTSTDTIYFGMIVDGYDHVSESNESNNKNRGTGLDRDRVRIEPGNQKADLRSSSFDSPESLTWGTSFTVSGSVLNQGNAPSGGSWAKVVLSSDSNITSNDRYLGWQYIGGLNSGASTNYSKTVQLPTSAPAGFSANGAIYIGVVLDAYQNRVDESNENNNSDRDRVNVSSQNNADSNDAISEAISLGSINVDRFQRVGTIDAQDVDMFSFQVTANQRIFIDVDRVNASNLDSFIKVFDSSGNQIAFNDDGRAPDESYSLESYLTHQFSNAGTYYVGVSGYGNSSYSPLTGNGDRNGSTGSYSLRIGVSMVAPMTHMDQGQNYTYLSNTNHNWYSNDRYYSRGINPLDGSNPNSNPGNRSLHNGLDINAISASNPTATNIFAPESGRIVEVRQSSGEGLVIRLVGDSGIEHVFAHMDPLQGQVIVSANQRVGAGQRIGRLAPADRMGTHSTHPHLHYGTRYHGVFVDPVVFYPGRNLR